MQHIEINGETRFYDDTDGLLDLIEEKMGHDTREAVDDLRVKNNCGGECDETYRIHEHYVRVIRGAVEDLERSRKPGKLGSVDSVVFSRVLKALEAEL